MVDILNDKFTWINGTIEDFSPMYDDENSALMFHLQDDIKNAGFIFDNKLASVLVTAEINIDKFNGEIELVHHFLDRNNYDFLGLKKSLDPATYSGEIYLSRKNNGKIEIFEKDKFQSKGWLEIKVVADASHFRGYVNNKLIVHGHGDEPDPGGVGLHISGQGSFSLKEIKTESLKK